MAAKPDAYVCQPSVTINDPRTAVLVHFDQMNPETLKGTGTSHQIAMTTLDAMRLLGLLQAIQRKFDLPQIVSEPEHTRIPKKKEQN